MSTMNISLPDSLKAFVDEQVSQRGYGTSSEYVRELIRRDQDRLQLRQLLLAGAASAASIRCGLVDDPAAADVWVADGLERVFQDDLTPRATARRAVLSAARGEAESFQMP